MFKILNEACDPELANNRSLPYTSYLVTYLVDGVETHDITICSKAVDLFDQYYDKYKKDFIKFDQTEGRVNPKQWNPPGSEEKKK
tara:strand:- start:988 stop:1242 length:255 start_codon:yes stop_codon:yes gene_type:complete